MPLSHLSLHPSLHPRHSFLYPEPSIRRPRRLELLPAQPFLHLLYPDQLLNLHDHTSNLGADGVEHGPAAAVQTQGFEHALGPCGEADGGAMEGDAEEGHCCCCAGGGGGLGFVIYGIVSAAVLEVNNACYQCFVTFNCLLNEFSRRPRRRYAPMSSCVELSLGFRCCQDRSSSLRRRREVM